MDVLYSNLNFSFVNISLAFIYANKIFTKVLANRLQTILPHVISKNQSAYVKGRDIADNILLMQ